jgi:hypothetical protein
MQLSSGSGRDPDKPAATTLPPPPPDRSVEWESPRDERAEPVEPAVEAPRESRAAALRRKISPGSGARTTEARDDRDVDAPDVDVRDVPVEHVERDAVAGEVPAESRSLVTEHDIEVLTRGQDLGIFRARRRFGGFDAGASVAGLLAATGMTALLGGMAGAVGTIGYQLDTASSTETLSTTGFVTGLVVLVLSFLFGGWVAGRVARYDGGLNGLVAAGLFVALSAIMAGLGTWFGDRYDVFADIRLPQWFSNTSSTTAVLSAVVALVVMVAAGWFGGVIGSRYHHRADRYLAEYAQGGKPVTAEALLADSRSHRRHLLHR